MNDWMNVQGYNKVDSECTVYPASRKHEGKMLVWPSVCHTIHTIHTIHPWGSMCVYLHPQWISCSCHKPPPCLRFSSYHHRSLRSAETRQAFEHFRKQAICTISEVKRLKVRCIHDKVHLFNSLEPLMNELYMCENYCKLFQVYSVTSV